MLTVVKADAGRFPYRGDHLDPTVIEVGDKVAWLDTGHGPFSVTSAVLGTVTRFTRTQIIAETTIGREARFSRETGQMVGRGSWAPWMLDPADPRIVSSRILSTARQAVKDIETSARGATCRDIPSAVTELEKLSRVVNGALRRMAELATDPTNKS
jgi:hypothetical protein